MLAGLPPSLLMSRGGNKSSSSEYTLLGLMFEMVGGRGVTAFIVMIMLV